MNITPDLVSKHNMIKTYEFEYFKFNHGNTFFAAILERCHDSYVFLKSKELLQKQLKEITG